MKKVWYLLVEHVPTLRNGEPDGDPILWAHGKGDSCVPPEEVNTEWLEKNGFRTESSAIRTSYRATAKYRDDFWSVGNVWVTSGEIPDSKLHYKIYRCYEIVILDDDENEIGNSNYCYGTRADAEAMARHELKIAEMEG